MWRRVMVRVQKRGTSFGVVAAIALAVPAAAGAADLPTQGTSLRTDGDRRIAVVAPDSSSVSVLDRRTSAVGVTPLPTAAAGATFASSVLGFTGDLVLLQVRETTDATEVPERYALVDAAGGGFRWLCGQRDDPVAVGVPLCPSVEGFPVYRPYAAGRDWIRMFASGPHGRGSAIRWGLRADGTFWWRPPTTKEERTVQSGEHLDLDHAAPRPEAPFGVRIRSSEAGSSRRVAAYVVRRTGDARRSTLRLADRARTGVSTPDVRSVQVGSSGVCIARPGQLVLLDRRTRRAWYRAAPTFGRKADFEAACAGTTIVTRVGTTLDWSLRRPTTAARAGWRSAGVLRPGSTLTVPAP